MTNPYAKIDYHDFPMLLREPYEKAFAPERNWCAGAAADWGGADPIHQASVVGMPRRRGGAAKIGDCDDCSLQELGGR